PAAATGYRCVSIIRVSSTRIRKSADWSHGEAKPVPTRAVGRGRKARQRKWSPAAAAAAEAGGDSDLFRILHQLRPTHWHILINQFTAPDGEHVVPVRDQTRVRTQNDIHTIAYPFSAAGAEGQFHGTWKHKRRRR